MSSKIKAGRLDKLGMVTSIACAVHCAGVPLVITSLPLIGMEFLTNEWIEISMIVLSVVVGTWALTGAYSIHKSFVPLMTLTLGFGLIGSGHLIENLESALVPLGGLSIAGAHYSNWRLSRSYCHDHC